ncbi:protein kinase C-like 3 isoform X2 [Varroa jacobsoni]|uniref:Protein kinase domain-containing protein n=1 Tax=Varroa destructor TaxID=109461 RepID=A0A7M7M974_VARDE|nr:protein kinase C-like 3 isoform X2 [Varroa destructor]XP_022702481.1 protein kinase C-like 3 isoform X2 [Varroa jacobsoni]
MVAIEPTDIELRLPAHTRKIRKSVFPSCEGDHIVKQRRKHESERQNRSKRTSSKAVPHEGPIRIPKVGTLVPDSFWANPLCKKACVFKVCNAIQVREAIGQGSFGTVFKITVGKDVAALKCVQKSAQSQDQLKELDKVKCEFSVWRAVSEHPNVISLIAFLQTDKNWCFVMEFAPLGSLSRYLKDTVGGPLEIDQSRRLAGQLAHAIYCVHQMGFLHRDISCSNVLLVKASDHPTLLDAKLTDFGLSMKGHSSSNRCGSLAYMSPEVLERTTYSSDADWWSYGIVVYCMFVGRTPLSVFARKEHIELSSLSRGMRYELAKTVTIHISRQLTAEQRAFLIDVLQDNPADRLGVWRFSYPDGTVSDSLEPLRQHKFLAGFNWSALTPVEIKLKQQQQLQGGHSGPLDSKEDIRELVLPNISRRSRRAKAELCATDTILTVDSSSSSV